MSLLQILNDVLAEIAPEVSLTRCDVNHTFRGLLNNQHHIQNKASIREEDPEVTITRMLNTLRMIKYKPPVNIMFASFYYHHPG